MDSFELSTRLHVRQIILFLVLAEVIAEDEKMELDLEQWMLIESEIQLKFN